MKDLPNQASAAGTFLAVMLAICNPTQSRGERCKPLSPAIEQTIVSYLQKRHALPNAADLKVSDVSLVKGTCYRRLTLESSDAGRSVVVYLTPDEGYLAPLLMDLSEDPQTELLRVQSEAMKTLLAGMPPAQGPVDAPVTIVEFGDFQCPHCAHFAQFMAQLPASQRSKVRLVFRQLPFPNHSWALEAAVTSTCVAFQDQRSFWRLHDFLYSQAHTFTADNAHSLLLRFAKDELQIDPAKINACVEQRMYEGTLAYDADLARRFNVTVTPTIFVNGRKYVGMHSIEDLKIAIDAALSERTPAVKQDGVSPSDGQNRTQ